MKVFKTKIIMCSILFLGIFSSCDKKNKPDYELSLIKVDSLNIQKNIVVNKPFDIEFFGTIGTNGCYKFSKFETNRLDNEIIVGVWGKFDKNAKVCSDVMVYLAGRKLRYTIEKSGDYTLKIKQPEGNYLTEYILVK